MARAKSGSKSKAKPKNGRQYNVRPDTLDFRDVMYEATLVEVPTRIDLDRYRTKSEFRYSIKKMTAPALASDLQLSRTTCCARGRPCQTNCR